MPYRDPQSYRSLADRIEQWDAVHGPIFDRLPIWFVVATDTHFVRSSAYGTKVMGWTAEELLSRPYWELIHEEDVAPTLEVVKRSPQASDDPDGNVIGFRNRYECCDGSYVMWEWETVRLPTVDGGEVTYGRAVLVS